MVRFSPGVAVAAALAFTVAADNSSEIAPVTHMETGSFHTVVIIRDSTFNVVKDWGANGKGQLGLNDSKDRGDTDGDVGDLLPEVVLSTTERATAVAAGLRHTVAILDDDTVRCWGYNGKGQLGVGHIRNVGDNENEMGDNMAVTELGTEVTPNGIYAGGWHTCAIVNADQLKCWGYNQWGELGLGDKNDRGDESFEMGDDLDYVDLGDDVSVTSLALGDWHSCALIDDGDVKCWGKNFAGQLGLDDTDHRGDNDGEMGDTLEAVYLGDLKATAIACGEEHTCAILEGGELRCWGLGSSGQLGQGNSENVGDSSGDMSNLLGIDLGEGRTAVEVTAGGNHTCARLDNDDVKCWGSNEYGQLGQGDNLFRGYNPNEMGDFLEPIDFGTDRIIHSLSAGYYHNCALVDEIDEVGAVACWGANFKGQMGLGISETENIGDDPDEMGDNLQTADLGGNFVDENEEKWYEKTWFYIACGVLAGLIMCCLCILIKYSHRDTGGWGDYKHRQPTAASAQAPEPVSAEPNGTSGTSDPTDPPKTDPEPTTTTSASANTPPTPPEGQV